MGEGASRTSGGRSSFRWNFPWEYIFYPIYPIYLSSSGGCDHCEDDVHQVKVFLRILLMSARVSWRSMIVVQVLVLFTRWCWWFVVLVILPLQVFPTYLMAGCGMVCAGLMLDMVTAWPAFKVSLSLVIITFQSWVLNLQCLRHNGITVLNAPTWSQSLFSISSSYS